MCSRPRSRSRRAPTLDDMQQLKSVQKLIVGLLALMALLLASALLLVPGVHISSLGMILNVVTGAGGDTPPDKLLVSKSYKILESLHAGWLQSGGTQLGKRRYYSHGFQVGF